MYRIGVKSPEKWPADEQLAFQHLASPIAHRAVGVVLRVARPYRPSGDLVIHLSGFGPEAPGAHLFVNLSSWCPASVLKELDSIDAGV